MDWIAEHRDEGQYALLGELFEKKLWHELTMRVDSVVKSEKSASNLLGLADNFLPKFDKKINQLKYAQILCGIVARCAGTDVLSADAAIARLEETSKKNGDRLGTEAKLFVEMETACLRLKFYPNDIKAVKEQLDKAKPTIDALTGTTDTAVFNKYYAASAAYYKINGPPEDFYRAALSLLSYASEDDLSMDTPDAKYQLATDMSLAALVGDGVYNFGEVLATPILGALENTPNAWLGQLLQVFARGDVDAFATVVSENSAQFNACASLVARTDFLKEKITLLALMNLLFETPSHMRTIQFQQIANTTSLDLDQVEWLAMRAMALGLVKGQIDQVNTTIHFTWVAPKVLDNDQITHLVNQLDTLSEKATTALNIIHDKTVDLL